MCVYFFNSLAHFGRSLCPVFIVVWSLWIGSTGTQRWGPPWSPAACIGMCSASQLLGIQPSSLGTSWLKPAYIFAHTQCHSLFGLDRSPWHTRLSTHWTFNTRIGFWHLLWASELVSEERFLTESVFSTRGASARRFLHYSSQIARGLCALPTGLNFLIKTSKFVPVWPPVWTTLGLASILTRCVSLLIQISRPNPAHATFLLKGFTADFYVNLGGPLWTLVLAFKVFICYQLSLLRPDWSFCPLIYTQHKRVERGASLSSHLFA